MGGTARGPGLGSVAGCVRRETGRPLRHPASAGRACQRGGPGAWLCGLDAFAGKQGVRFATRLRPAARASAEGPGNGRRTCRAAALPAAVRPLCAAALPAATRPLCSAALPAATRPLRAAALPAATRPLRAAPSASVCPHALAALVASAKARPSMFVLLFKMFRPLLTRQSTYAMIWMAFRKAAARCTCSRIRAGITSLTRNHIFSALCPPNRIWKRIEVVITGLTRTQVVRKGSWVRIPPLPPNKNRNFDTMRIKVAVLSCATKALIPRGFWLLSAPAVARQSESLPPAQYAKALGSSRLSFGLWVSFNLWAIVWRLLSQSRKHHCSCDL